MGEQHKAGLPGRKPLGILQEEAHEKDDAEGGRVVAHGRQAAQGKIAVAGQQRDVQQGAGAAHLHSNEYDEPDRTDGDHRQSPDIGLGVGRPGHDQADAGRIGQAAAPVHGLALGVFRHLLHAEEAHGDRRDADGNG